MQIAVSEETPKPKKDSWAQYYAERGVTRAPMKGTARQPIAPRATAATTFGQVPPPKSPEVSPDLAVAVAAVAADLSGTTAAPFLTAMHREAALIEARRIMRIKVLKAGLWLTAVLIVLPLLARFAFNREPSDEALEAIAQKTTVQLLALLSNAALPLRGDAAICELRDRIDLTHLRYEVQATLRLREDLVVPAQTNGTQAYRQLQASVREAQQLDLKLHLFSAADGRRAPELPRLLQISRHAGDPVVVRVPFRAERFGWSWRFTPPQLGLRLVNDTLEGDTIERYAGSPYLVFGPPERFAEVRELMTAARDYILAVKKEAQLRAIVDGELNATNAAPPPPP